MLGRGRHQAVVVERPPAPDALRPVALEDDLHPLAAAELPWSSHPSRLAHGEPLAVAWAPMSGRFAPSPTGELHLGNLRTALLAWLAARSTGRDFLIRMEDLDRVTSSVDHERRQVADMAALGLDHDGEIVRQSERFELYRSHIDRLAGIGRVYPCYCTRREIREEIESATSAPHGLPDGAYPGTCRDLTADERAEREAAGRTPALRLRTEGERFEFVDRVLGRVVGFVDDVVLARADGVPAYNLAVVVDDEVQAIDQVVRGDDLASSTPRQLLLQRLLGFRTPEYQHVPLVLGPTGRRLAKRDGAVTLAELAADGWTTAEVLAVLARSVGLASVTEPDADITAELLVDRYDPGAIPTSPSTYAELRALRS